MVLRGLSCTLMVSETERRGGHYPRNRSTSENLGSSSALIGRCEYAPDHRGHAVTSLVRVGGDHDGHAGHGYHERAHDVDDLGYYGSVQYGRGNGRENGRVRDVHGRRLEFPLH